MQEVYLLRVYSYKSYKYYTIGMSDDLESAKARFKTEYKWQIYERRFWYKVKGLNKRKFTPLALYQGGALGSTNYSSVQIVKAHYYPKFPRDKSIPVVDTLIA